MSDDVEAMRRRYRKMGVDLDRPRLSGGVLDLGDVTVEALRATAEAKNAAPSKACDRWGGTGRPQTDDPACVCLLCSRTRLVRAEALKKKPRRGRKKR